MMTNPECVSQPPFHTRRHSAQHLGAAPSSTRLKARQKVPCRTNLVLWRTGTRVSVLTNELTHIRYRPIEQDLEVPPTLPFVVHPFHTRVKIVIRGHLRGLIHLRHELTLTNHPRETELLRVHHRRDLRVIHRQSP